MEKSKAEKKSLGKENEGNWPKEERKSSILSSKEKQPYRKRQRLLVGQTPTTSSASAEDPKRSKTLLARVLPLPLPLASLPIITGSS